MHAFPFCRSLSRSRGLALDVTVRWQGELLAARRLEGAGSASIGALPGALVPIPCEDEAGVAPFVFAEVVAGGASARIPGGGVGRLQRSGQPSGAVVGPVTLTLAAGDRVELALGRFELCAECLVAERRAPSPVAWFGGAAVHVAVAALVHAVLLGAGARAARAAQLEPSGDEEPSAGLRALLLTADQRARAEDPAVEDAGGADRGGEVNDASGDGLAGGGVPALGPRGAAGSRGARAREGHYALARRSVEALSPELAAKAARFDAGSFGVVGLLGQGPPSPTAPFGADEARGADALAARGSLWAPSIGETVGAGALGLRGVGEGGGGDLAGIGLGRVGTIGHTDGPSGPGTGGAGSPLRGAWGSGSSWGGGSWDGIGVGARSPRIQVSLAARAAGRDGILPREAIQRVVRQNFGRFRLCYERGLVRSPTLEGRVNARFLIGADGLVSATSDAGSDLPDASVVRCVVQAFGGLSFPAPPGGASITVSYPIVFSPTG